MSSPRIGGAALDHAGRCTERDPRRLYGHVSVARVGHGAEVRLVGELWVVEALRGVLHVVARDASANEDLLGLNRAELSRPRCQTRELDRHRPLPPGATSAWKHEENSDRRAAGRDPAYTDRYGDCRLLKEEL